MAPKLGGYRRSRKRLGPNGNALVVRRQFAFLDLSNKLHANSAPCNEPTPCRHDVAAARTLGYGRDGIEATNG
jgi:hypothetical protein